MKVQTLPIADRIRQPLRQTLGGGAGEWPELTAGEARALALHGVAPLVYASARLPALRDYAMHAAAIEPMRLADLRAVLAALAKRGIDALLLKGTPLAYEIYPIPELRPRGDTDLLIAREELEAVRETMLGLGFEERLTSGDEHGVRQALFTRRDAYGVEHAYDVHWDVTNTPVFADVLRFEELHARAVDVKALGARTLCRVDALLLACIHRVAHHHDSDRLIWLVDIALLRDGMSREEHEQFWRLAAERRVVGVCRRSIELADEWCMREARNRAAEFLSREEHTREEPSRAFLDQDMSYGRMMLADFRALPWPARVRRMWQLALPPAEFMRRSFPERSRFALPWLYVYRGARGLRRLFRRADAR